MITNRRFSSLFKNYIILGGRITKKKLIYSVENRVRFQWEKRYLDLVYDMVLLEKKMIFLLLSIALQFFFNKISQQSQEDTLKAFDYIYPKECIVLQRYMLNKIFFFIWNL